MAQDDDDDERRMANVRDGADICAASATTDTADATTLAPGERNAGNNHAAAIHSTRSTTSIHATTPSPGCALTATAAAATPPPPFAISASAQQHPVGTTATMDPVVPDLELALSSAVDREMHSKDSRVGSSTAPEATTGINRTTVPPTIAPALEDATLAEAAASVPSIGAVPNTKPICDPPSATNTSVVGAIRCNGDNNYTPQTVSKQPKGLRRSSHEEASATPSLPVPLTEAATVSNTLQRGLQRTAEELEAKRQARSTTMSSPHHKEAAAVSNTLQRGLQRTAEELEAKRQARSTTMSSSRHKPKAGLRNTLADIQAKQNLGHPTGETGVATVPDVLVEDEETNNKKGSALLRFFAKRAPLYDYTPPPPVENIHVEGPISDQSQNQQRNQLQPPDVTIQPGAVSVVGTGQQHAIRPPAPAGTVESTQPATVTVSTSPETRRQGHGTHQEPTILGLAVASLVSESSQRVLDQAQEVDPAELERRSVKEAKERQCRWIGFVLIVGALTIIVGTILGTRDKGSGASTSNWSPTPTPTAAPTASTLIQIKDHIDSIFAGQNVTFEDDSVQKRAYEWLLDFGRNPNILNSSDKTILQRYALATLYYATAGEKWTNQDKWMSPTSECDWHYQSLLIQSSPIYQGNRPCHSKTNSANTSDEEIYLHLLLDANNLDGLIPPEIFLYLPHLKMLSMAENGYNSTDFRIWKTENPRIDESQYFRYEDPPLGFPHPLPSQIGLLTNLETATLGSNQHNGTFPLEITALTSIKDIRLDGNNLTGPVPSELGLMTSLAWLDLQLNSLTGPVPSELGLMTSLTWLNLHSNSLTGPVPSQLRLMTSLAELHLYSNTLTGPVPSELGLMTSLTWLRLDSNSLIGTVPSELGLMTSLTVLHLGSNGLTGPIPSELGLMTSLTWLDLHSNSLTGPVPSELGLMTSLTWLHLYSNSLTAGKLHGAGIGQVLALATNGGFNNIAAKSAGVADGHANKCSICSCALRGRLRVQTNVVTSERWLVDLWRETHSKLVQTLPPYATTICLPPHTKRPVRTRIFEDQRARGYLCLFGFAQEPRKRFRSCP